MDQFLNCGQKHFLWGHSDLDLWQPKSHHRIQVNLCTKKLPWGVHRKDLEMDGLTILKARCLWQQLSQSQRQNKKIHELFFNLTATNSTCTVTSVDLVYTVLKWLSIPFKDGRAYIARCCHGPNWEVLMATEWHMTEKHLCVQGRPEPSALVNIWTLT